MFEKLFAFISVERGSNVKGDSISLEVKCGKEAIWKPCVSVTGYTRHMMCGLRDPCLDIFQFPSMPQFLSQKATLSLFLSFRQQVLSRIGWEAVTRHGWTADDMQLTSWVLTSWLKSLRSWPCLQPLSDCWGKVGEQRAGILPREEFWWRINIFQDAMKLKSHEC